jgi:uncharacterized membrane protein
MIVHRCIVCVAALAPLQSVEASVGFDTLHAWPGIFAESAADMTPDGAIVVGSLKNVGPNRAETFRWTSGTNFESLGLQLGAGSLARAVSADGHVIVGTVNADIGYSTARPFYWRDGQGLTLPGLLPGGSYGWATGVSADGSTMVGYGDNPAGVGWKWTATGGYQILSAPAGYVGAVVAPHGVSATGDTIAGYVRDGTNNAFAVRWNAAGAQVCPVPGIAQSIQRDGHAILFAGSTDAMRWWNDGRIDDLGAYPGAIVSWPTATSDDGSIICGSGVIAAYTGRAWIWTAPTGLVDLRDYLQQRGVDLSGWVLASVASISADGTIICGYGTHTYSPGNSRDETFIATVPGPMGAPLLTIGAIALAARRTRTPARTQSPGPGSAATC